MKWFYPELLLLGTDHCCFVCDGKTWLLSCKFLLVINFFKSNCFTVLGSQAKKVGFTYFTENSKLFIYIYIYIYIYIKNICPSIDPCETLYLMYYPEDK